jgi:hypothetical protein
MAASKLLSVEAIVKTENQFRIRDLKNQQAQAKAWFIESRSAWLERPNCLSQEFSQFCKDNLATIWDNRNGTMLAQYRQLNGAYMDSTFGLMTEGNI